MAICSLRELSVYSIDFSGLSVIGTVVFFTLSGSGLFVVGVALVVVVVFACVVLSVVVVMVVVGVVDAFVVVVGNIVGDVQ